ncbi:carboxyl transferase domain-containing protein [Actinomycetes bacterium KLBMP 9797]
MAVLDTALDPRDPSYLENRAAMLSRLAELGAALDAARGGGGEKYVTRHHARGKLLPRERIELLLDRDAPFLELSPIAAWGTEYPVGASLVTGVGVVAGVECVMIANDPTVRGGEVNPYTVRKAQRAVEIALANRLPLVNLIESGGADLTGQTEIFIPGGGVLRDLSRLSAAGIPTVSVVFGSATAAGAYAPGVCEYTIMVRNQARVFLAGPQLVRMATGEVTDDESLGGAAMHATRSGLADYVAEDERDGIRLARQCLRRRDWRKAGRAPHPLPAPPKHDPEDLLAVASADLAVPFDPREVLARVLDGSEFDEFKPAYGPALVTGWGQLHGYPVGVLANARGALLAAEAAKAAQFVQLANAAGTPLIFLQNTTGHAVGTEAEQGGIVKHGALMMNAVATSTVPHLTVNLGASYGAASYGMCGLGYGPRFLFTWPNAKAAMLSPTQLAGVLSIAARQSAEAKGQLYEDESDQAMRAAVERQVATESAALFLSGRLSDDGVIDPRDTRSVLGLCLSAIHSGPIEGAANYGVFRM